MGYFLHFGNNPMQPMQPTFWLPAQAAMTAMGTPAAQGPVSASNASLPSKEPRKGNAPADGFVFQAFQRQHCQPTVSLTPLQKFAQFIFHPVLAFQLSHDPTLLTPSGEGLAERIKMYSAVRHSLPWSSMSQLNVLRKQGILNDTKTLDAHSTLYYLYAMKTTERLSGCNADELLRETVDILANPERITQKFTPLSDSAAQSLLDLRNRPGANPHGPAQPAHPITREDLDVQDSATCVDASMMYDVARKEPGELARQLNELFSPMHAFYKQARLSEISPDNPAHALELLQHSGASYVLTGPDTVTVKVVLPQAGVIRALNDQSASHDHQYRNAIETAYQSALMHLATSSYDPATDLRDSEQPGETSKGLTEEEKTMMEAIIKAGHPIQSVTYQVVNGKNAPKPGEENNSYLYGYSRPFAKIADDLVTALQANELVIVGLTDTDADGNIIGGHEVTLTQAFRDKDGELKFRVADSDDDNPNLVVRSARELVPRIHHAAFPLSQARRINSEIAAVPGYLVPDEGDAARFSLLQYSREKMPEAMPTGAPGANMASDVPPPPYTATLPAVPTSSLIPGASPPPYTVAASVVSSPPVFPVYPFPEKQTFAISNLNSSAPMASSMPSGWMSPGTTLVRPNPFMQPVPVYSA